MRVFLSVLVLVAAAGAGIAYVQEAQPAWYERLRYPLSYDHIVVGHAAISTGDSLQASGAR